MHNHTIKRFLKLAALFFLILTSCSSAEEEKQKLYQEALGLIESGQTNAAILNLRSAIQLDAKFEPARYQLGLLYLENKDPQKAFGEFLRAADLNPENIDANLKVAEFYFMGRKKEESRKYLQKVLDIDGKHVRALSLLAALELTDKKPDQTLEILESLGEETSNKANLQMLKGQALLAKEETEEAEKAFRNAINADKKNLTHYKMLLGYYERKQDKEQTKILLDEMRQNFPDNTEINLLFAGYYKAERKWEKVEKELLNAVKLQPENERLRLILAKYYASFATQEKAIETLKKASQEITDNKNILAELGSMYFDNKNFEEFEKIAAQLKDKDPEHQALKLFEARKMQKDGAVKESISLLQQLNTDYPNWAEPYFYLALAHFSQKEMDLARLEVNNAIQKNRKNAKAHTLLAQILLTEKNYDDAIKEASIALRLNNKNLRAMIILSRALIGAKKSDEALKILTQINEQLPENKEVIFNLANAFINSGDKEAGTNLLEDLLEFAPGNPQLILMLMNLKHKGNIPEAEKFVREQIKKAPNDARPYIVLGSLLKRQGKRAESLETYKKAQALNPNIAEAYFAIASILKAEGKTEEAIQEYQKIIEKKTDSIPGHMGLAVLMESKGNIEQAKKHYQKVLELDKNYPPAANNLAWIIASEPDGDLGKALLLAMTAKKASPEDPNIADTLGWIYLKRGSNELAIAQFELALQNKKNNPAILYHLAMAQNAKGDTQKALASLKQCLEIKETFPDRKNAEKLFNQLKTAQ